MHSQNSTQCYQKMLLYNQGVSHSNLTLVELELLIGALITISCLTHPACNVLLRGKFTDNNLFYSLELFWVMGTHEDCNPGEWEAVLIKTVGN